MERETWVKLALNSLIMGAILGLLTLVPYLNILTLIVLSLFLSVIIYVKMQKDKQIGDLSMKGAVIVGAVIGFIGLVAFSIILLPTAAIIDFILRVNIFMNFSLLLPLWWLILIMGGLIVSMFNACSLVFYIYVKDTYFMIEGKKEIAPKFEVRERR